MIDEEFYIMVEFPLALRVSAILCRAQQHGQLDAIMETFAPYLKEIYALQRRKRLKLVK